MTLWKIVFSKTFLLIIVLKTLFLINFTFARLKYQYDSCDPRWSNDTLWLNFVLKTNSTICQDKDLSFSKYPQGFVSLAATAFANKNYGCGEFRVCDPGILNRDLIRCYHHIYSPENREKNQTLFECIGLKFINQTFKLHELEDEILTGFTLMAAHVYPNSNETNNRFLIVETYENLIKGVDYRGNNVIYPWEEIKGIEKFKISNVHKKKKKKKGKNIIEENTGNLNSDNNEELNVLEKDVVNEKEEKENIKNNDLIQNTKNDDGMHLNNIDKIISNISSHEEKKLEQITDL